MDHILSTGFLAYSIWRRVANTLGMFNVDSKNRKIKILIWFRGANERNLASVIVGILPIVITWKLWIRRCRA